MKTKLFLTLIVSSIVLFAMALDISWEEKSPLNYPSPRTQHRISYDAARDKIVLFGGYSSSGQVLDDTWNWDGGSWTERHPSHLPTRRIYHAMAFDEVRQETVLFGGYPKFGYHEGLGDSWTWDGNDWQQKFPAASPSPRELAAMTFDSVRGEMILFGGGIPNSSNFYSDTWAWTGTTWEDKAPISSPSPRIGAEMAFDAKNGNVVLFGGYNANGTFLDETWIWDGSNWSALTPAHKPSARWKFSMAYVPELERVICFGGYTANGCLNDLWAWDGQDWAAIPLPVQPPIRYGHGMAYDAGRSETILFGGHNGIFLSDTWGFKSPISAPIAACKDIEIPVNNQCQAFINARDIDNGSYDPKGGDLSYAIDFAGPLSPGEERLVTLTVTNSAGASDSCKARFKAIDQTGPIPDNAVLPVLRGSCSVSVTTPPTATDACSGQIVGTTQDPREYTQQGAYTITWVFSDGSGNETHQTQQVMIEDTVPPALSLSDPQCVILGPEKGNSWNLLTVRGIDNCGGIVDIKIDRVEIFNADGNLVHGSGILSIVGNDIFVNPNADSWSIRVTFTGRDPLGNTIQISSTKPLLKCR